MVQSNIVFFFDCLLFFFVLDEIPIYTTKRLKYKNLQNIFCRFFSFKKLKFFRKLKLLDLI